MKTRIIISLFLLAVFCAVPVFAQNAEKALQTEFIRLNNFKVEKAENDFNRLSDETSYLLGIIKPLLTKRGSIEIAVREKSLIVTDTEGRVKLIGELIKMLDESKLLINDLVSETPKEDEKIITETVKTNYIFPIISCLDGKESPWMVIQGFLLFKPMKQIKVRIRSAGLDRKDVNLTGTEKRVELAKRIVALFDQPFLTEEADYDF